MVERRPGDRRAARFLVALCPLAGLGAFLAWVFHRTGNPMDWVWAQGALWVLAMTVLLRRRRQWLYAGIIVCYLGPALAVDLLSIGRMTAVLFPASIAAASTFRGRAFIIVATVFAAGQACFAWRFFLWLPPF